MIRTAGLFLRTGFLAATMACITPLTQAQTTTVNLGHYDLLDSTLPSKLVDALNHRTDPTTDGSLRDSAPVIVAAHRGVVDRLHPENTLQSVINTMNYGIEAIELDVYESRDEVPYLMHDKTLKRMLDRAEYSDIYRWERESNLAAEQTPTWAEIKAAGLCDNRADGYGQTVDHPVCDKSTGFTATSLDEALEALYLNSYEGLVFLDLRETNNVRDVAAHLLWQIFDARDGVDEYSTWISRHLVLKFQTTLVNGPDDYEAKIRSRYNGKYGKFLLDTQLRLLYVQPVYASNSTTVRDQGGANSWAIDDFKSWENWFSRADYPDNLISPLIGLKAEGSILNYGQDDLFSHIWRSGRSVGVYVPKRLCTQENPQQMELYNDEGTWWEGGICGPLVPAMKDNECGSAGKTLYNRWGKGCVDHRPFKEWWHTTAKFGFLITDTPVNDIQYLKQFPGQRPGTGNTTNIEDLKGVNLSQVYPVTVAADGSGDFTSIDAALDSLPDSGGLVEIKPGTYNEKLLVSKDNVALVGMGSDASKVVITNNDYSAKTNPATGQPYGTSGSYTVAVTGSDFYATNLTIQNTANYEAPGYEANEQAVALLSKGERAVYRAVMVLGGQDTLYVTNGKRAYFDNCYVEGYVDFIFGSGKAVFDNCQIKAKVHDNLNGQVTITAQSRESSLDDNGFVFNNATLLFDDTLMDNVWLGRPWRAYSTVYFLNSKLGPQVRTPGWIEFVPEEYAPGQGTNNLPTSTYAEYKTLYPDGNGGWQAFDIGQRESISMRANIELSDAEAAALAADVYLKGTDGWKPTQITWGTLTQQELPIPTLPVGTPGAPRINSVTAGNKNIQVNWSGKAANPQTSGYRLRATQNGQTFGPVELPPTANTGFISGLANGLPATISVAGVNDEGVGEEAVSAAVTPYSAAPSVPSNIRFQVNGSSVTMAFDVEDEGGQPVFGAGAVEHAGVYTALYASRNDAFASKAIEGTSNGFTSDTWTFDNLSPDTTYWVSLWAYNGESSPTAIVSFHTGSMGSHCAPERQTCSFSGTREVAYGANGWFAFKTATDSIYCDNSVFGDPAPGTRKACYIK